MYKKFLRHLCGKVYFYNDIFRLMYLTHIEKKRWRFVWDRKFSQRHFLDFLVGKLGPCMENFDSKV